MSKPAYNEAVKEKRTHGKRKPILLFAAALIILVGGAAVAARGTPFRKDTEPPIITGTADRTVFTGDSVSYRAGVSVTDNRDPAPVLDVDNSAVDLTKPGTYTVTYTASDASGNVATAEATVTVLDRTEEVVSTETIDKAVAEVLAQIITADMDAREQVEAIYGWSRETFTYLDHTKRSDWRQAGYDMMKNRAGDCYGYFSAAKLLYEALGIPNIDVQKVRNYETDSEHFWSLVSVDGGETYYHVDCTPRGAGENYCLLTDAQLEVYSAIHKNSHNRDLSLYPATPEA